jgi:periplasmic mercuric ion binding protein
MKTKLFTTIIIFSLLTAFAFAGGNIKVEKIKVSGNCSQCKSRIEKTLKIKEVKFAKWDKKSKMLTVAYDTTAITSDSLQQLIASVGHDTEKFKAPDAVYNELPGCCLYRDGNKTH